MKKVKVMISCELLAPAYAGPEFTEEEMKKLLLDKLLMFENQFNSNNLMRLHLSEVCQGYEEAIGKV